jgi:hypothetical protein
MNAFGAKWIFGVLVVFCAFSFASSAQEPDERQLVDLTNEARAEGGAKPVVWDQALADAARAHAILMSREAEISHRYIGELDLPERAAKVGAHFSMIAENIAMGTTPGQVHGAWMQSKGHHDNLMNANVDHIGVAIVRARGALFVVADFSQAVNAKTPAEVEAAVGKMLTDKGLSLMSDASAARRYCTLEGKSGGDVGGEEMKPRFMMRWQNSDLSKLPPQLEQQLAGAQFKQGSVGACEVQGGAGAPVFSGYRVAVLLY